MTYARGKIKRQTSNKHLKTAVMINNKTNRRASADGLWLTSAVIPHSRRFTICGCLQHHHHHHHFTNCPLTVICIRNIVKAILLKHCRSPCKYILVPKHATFCEAENLKYKKYKTKQINLPTSTISPKWTVPWTTNHDYDYIIIKIIIAIQLPLLLFPLLPLSTIIFTDNSYLKSTK